MESTETDNRERLTVVAPNVDGQQLDALLMATDGRPTLWKLDVHAPQLRDGLFTLVRASESEKCRPCPIPNVTAGADSVQGDGE